LAGVVADLGHPLGEHPLGYPFGGLGYFMYHSRLVRLYVFGGEPG
jgi:hypothetical protein